MVYHLPVHNFVVEVQPTKQQDLKLEFFRFEWHTLSFSCVILEIDTSLFKTTCSLLIFYALFFATLLFNCLARDLVKGEEDIVILLLVHLRGILLIMLFIDAS